jgi:biotin carboxyl carrier protein
MAYSSNVNGQSYQVEIASESNPLQISLDGEKHTLDYQKVGGLALATHGGHYSILIAGCSYDLFAQNISRAGEKGSQTYEILLGGQRFEVKVEDERTRLLGNLSSTTNNASEAKIEAPMPGLVIGLPFEAGEMVNEGQTVVVLEAMKMENDLTAPISGQIKEVHVSKGQSVDQGELLMVIGGAQAE